MKGRPLFIPLASIIAGILIAGLYSTFVPYRLLAPLLVISFITIFLQRRFPFLLAISLLLFCWGNLSIKDLLQPEFPANHIARFIAEGPVTLEGVVDSRPESTEKGSRVYLACEKIYQSTGAITVSGRVLIHVGPGQITVGAGDRIRLVSRLHRPRNFGLPGEYDYARHLALQGVWLTAFAPGVDELLLVMGRVDHPVQRFIDDLAGEMGRFIARSVPQEEGGILRALLIGERGYVPHALETAYATTGVNHILSISGFHVGVIALFMFHLLFGVCRNFSFLTLHCNLRKSLLLITLPIIVFYLAVSGTAPATARSVIMIAAWVFALSVEREVEPINGLILAAAVILAITPGALFDISFQLSFVALWGIVVLTPLFMSPLARYKNRTLLHKGFLFLMASLAAIVATLFPVAFYFHRVSFTGLISNLVVVPLMGYGAVVVGFAALPFIFVYPLVARLLLLSAALMVKLSDAFILFISRIPALPLFTPDRLDLLLFYLLLMALTFIHSRQLKTVLGALLVLSIAGNGLLLKIQDKGRLQITFFSIGQGESTLIRFPNGKTMLVDGGGSARQGGTNVGERLLAPALWTLGIRSIDYLVLTHAHPDHLQGLLYIVENFAVGEFWENRFSVDDGEDYRTLKALVARRGIKVHEVGALSPAVAIGDARIDFLWPRPGLQQIDSDLNAHSLVFRLVYGKGSILFTGDIGTEAEDQLIASNKDLHADLLKVAHHGSRYSSSIEFLQKVSPDMALISAGYDNSFHLPAQSTLDRLQHQHVVVYRTDLNGTVTVVYDEPTGKFIALRQNWHFH